jgi:hypothetical protein
MLAYLLIRVAGVEECDFATGKVEGKGRRIEIDS